MVHKQKFNVVQYYKWLYKAYKSRQQLAGICITIANASGETFIIYTHRKRLINTTFSGDTVLEVAERNMWVSYTSGFIS